MTVNKAVSLATEKNERLKDVQKTSESLLNVLCASFFQGVLSIKSQSINKIVVDSP